MLISQNQKELLEIISLGEDIGNSRDVSDRFREIFQLGYVDGKELHVDDGYDWHDPRILPKGKRALADYYTYIESQKPLNKLKAWFFGIIKGTLTVIDSVITRWLAGLIFLVIAAVALFAN
jgi:predicted SnoaL-like aldol condensation-catalyzing enzyme